MGLAVKTGKTLPWADSFEFTSVFKNRNPDDNVDNWNNNAVGRVFIERFRPDKQQL